MRSALRNVPEQPKSMPNSMVTVRISKESGCPASPDDDGDVMFEIFSKNGLPTCKNEGESIDIFN